MVLNYFLYSVASLLQLIIQETCPAFILKVQSLLTTDPRGFLFSDFSRQIGQLLWWMDHLHLLDSGGGPRPAMEGCSHGVFKTTWNPCQATVPHTCSCKWKYVHFGKERKNSFALCHRSLALRFSHHFTPPPPFGKYLWISKIPSNWTHARKASWNLTSCLVCTV